jgi:hypothetical protein
MHQEHVEAVTRRQFDQWARELGQNGATPAVGIGVSQTEPGRVVLCIHERMTTADLKQLLAYCLAEVCRAEESGEVLGTAQVQPPAASGGISPAPPHGRRP